MADKDTERVRYDNSAKQALDNNDLSSVNNLTEPLRPPYKLYQSLIFKHVNRSGHILEIGAGMGENTKILLNTGAHVCATDISEKSLKVLKKRFPDSQLTTKVADMEKLPFDDVSFDMVVSAGSLSYGDNDIVRHEIYRVLKPGGVFVAIDSLNHNPIYRLNRYIHYLRNRRSLSTLQRMPTLKLLEKYQLKFGQIDIVFFGTISYLSPIFNKMLGERISAKISNKMDALISVKKSAFKFVMVVKKE